MIRTLPFFLLALSVLGAQVKLAWDSNPEPDIAGYRILRGTSPDNFITAVDVGNSTNYTDTVLPGTYYYAALAQNLDGALSAPSNVVVAAVPPGATNQKALIVIEDVLWTNCSTKVQELAAYMTADNLSVEILRYDSRGKATNGGVVGYNGKVNNSSKAARALAMTNIWPKVNAGVQYILMLGELPIPWSGLNQSPDGHGSTFTYDGWRDTQNTAGGYPCPQFYGTPAPFDSTGWNDIQNAPISLNTQRMNSVGDGRFDTEFLPVRPKAAVGWVGGYGDTALDKNGVDRRAGFINAYLTRNIKLRNLHGAGAAYQFTTNSTVPQSSRWFWQSLSNMYGIQAIADGQNKVTGANLTNRTFPFDIIYGGSDYWDAQWFGRQLINLTKPAAKIVFIHQSFSKSVPTLGSSLLSRAAITGNTNHGPVVVIPWNGSAGWNIEQLKQGKRVGDMILSATNLPLTSTGLLGDPTFRLN